MVRLEIAGPHTRLGSTLCASCPHSSAGCCVGPPDFGWSDVARVVTLGGRDWLLEEIAAGRLLPRPHGLAVKREKRREAPHLPRLVKCVYHGARGCTIAPERRMAVCNYYLCGDAYADGARANERVALLARWMHGKLMSDYARWDRELGEAITEASWSAEFLDWLGAELTAKLTGVGGALTPIG